MIQFDFVIVTAIGKRRPMSDDGTFIVRRDGQERFFYVRWGGSYIDRALLRGPDAFFDFLQSTRTTSTPFLEVWISGIVRVDADQQHVWFWSSQLPATTSLELRLLLSLLREAWSGWRLSLLHDPAQQVAALLGQHSPDRALQAPSPMPIESFTDVQHSAWREAQAQQDCSDEIAQYGEIAVRRWFEDDTHKSVAFIEDAQGVHEVIFCDEWDASALLRTGPDAIDALRQQTSLCIEEVVWESEIDSAYWLDLRTHTLWFWSGQPLWCAHPVRLASTMWPDWTLLPEPGGAWSMLQKRGRDPRMMVPDDAQKRLREMLSRILGAQPSGAEILARAVADLDTPPGAEVQITPPGPGHAGAQGGSLAWVWPAAEALLADPVFHPVQSPDSTNT